jgi:hypothetical protein
VKKLKYAERVGEQQANGAILSPVAHRPDANTPFTPEELREIRENLERLSVAQLEREYEDAWQWCKLRLGKLPPRPPMVQQFIQIWRELHRRRRFRR